MLIMNQLAFWILLGNPYLCCWCSLNKSTNDMGASPDALCLYQTWFCETIWFGSDCESLGSTFSGPLLGEVGFVASFTLHFALFLCAPPFPLSISDCGCSALVNCWTPIQHGKDQYNEPS
uniref:Secreted protein n=1 Tax=Setaria viridis TaxID=4556 RepID=A0A4V6Y815_SETVI|nr:hypothetical protein SEVIR_7G099850v2 [Setaria viridis]